MLTGWLVGFHTTNPSLILLPTGSFPGKENVWFRRKKEKKNPAHWLRYACIALYCMSVVGDQAKEKGFLSQTDGNSLPSLSHT